MSAVNSSAYYLCTLVCATSLRLKKRRKKEGGDGDGTKNNSQIDLLLTNQSCDFSFRFPWVRHTAIVKCSEQPPQPGKVGNRTSLCCEAPRAPLFTLFIFRSYASINSYTPFLRISDRCLLRWLKQNHNILPVKPSSTPYDGASSTCLWIRQMATQSQPLSF